MTSPAMKKLPVAISFHPNPCPMTRWIPVTLLLFAVALCAQDRPLPWSFLPLEEKPLPGVRDAGWPQNRADHFVLARMEAANLHPAPPSDDRVLLRRLYFTLTGLPPSYQQFQDFKRRANQGRQAAVREEVETLLASPHYGERWARHWLDLARYTDTTASWLQSTADPWRYRDWVVRAFNEDLPYTEFVRRQLANDLIPGHDPADHAALGFLGLSPTYWKEPRLAPEVIKTTVADEWEERMDVVGRTFLGLALGCARCHGHKADPISQADYYGIAGVFASTRITDRPMMAEELWKPVSAARQKVAALEKQIANLDMAYLKKKGAGATEEAEATKAKKEALQAEVAGIKESTPHYNMSLATAVEDSAIYVKPSSGFGTTIEYKTGQSRDLAIHNRGNPNDPGETVPRRFLSAFPAQDGQPRKFGKGSGRLDLADSITGEASPLAARVIVNRVWLHYFGKGLVRTPSELGLSGAPPTHPDLLDDLSARFVANGWSIKWLHREILLSATWQQGLDNPSAILADPDNALLARMDRRRLDVESWRDAMLVATGQLDSSIGGAPMDLDSKDNRRRTLYGKIHRREPNQFLRLHDFPDPTAHSPSRTMTITPLQQLFSLNGPFLLQQAEALAGSLDGPEKVRDAYHRLFQREPTDAETAIAQAFLEGRGDGREAWAEFAHALLACNEFLFIE
jgi:hypothetical protein